MPTQIRRGPWSDRRVRTRVRIPALTVLYHPDSRRVGERVLLHELATGKGVEVSRSELGFSAPGESRFRPLDDPYLSRKPILLAHDPQAALIRLSTGASSTRVVADGVAIETERSFQAEEVERGVVLELGRRIVLLLSRISAMPIDPRRNLGLIGDSDAMARVHEEIATVADLRLPVLLRGETGTGKELVARAIHAAGKLRDCAFLGLNMAAITPSLAASELFGAAKGAFTGAVRGQAGYFQRAHGGTLFLDEIGATPPEVQVMLLRVLETGEVQRVGTQEPQQVDVRLIAATDADLEGEIEAGRFRAPLLHRLAGYEISIPPLRLRRDDFGRLLFHFLRQELSEIGEAWRLDPDASEAPPWLPMSIVARLARYDWPGNVRQLRNVARQLVVGSRGADAVRVPAPVERLLRQAVASEGPALATEGSGGPQPALPVEEPQRSAFRKPSDVDEDELHEALRDHRWELKPTAAA
ncbi:MAG: sigma 54-interacting transcriptional regulator, partial [Acidobacteriota bacterium]